MARPQRLEQLVVALACVTIAGLWLLLAANHGVLGIPRNDDWAYYRIAFGFAGDGTFVLNGWPGMNLFGHIVLAWPIVQLFGEQILPLQIMVAVWSAVGLWATYRVVRSFLAAWWAALAVSCLALGPIYGTLTASFMTDIPAFALGSLSLLAGVAALGAGRRAFLWFVVALALSLAAFTIRESGAAAGAAVLVAVLWGLRREPGVRATRFFAVAAAWVVFLAGMNMWRNALPNSASDVIHFWPAGDGLIGSTWIGAVTLAVFVLPAIVTLSPAAIVRRAWGRSKAVTSLIVVAVGGLAVVGPQAFLDSYFNQNGALSATRLPGPTQPILDPAVWGLLRFAGFGGTLLVALMVLVAAPARASDRRTADPAIRLVLLFCVACAIATIGFVVVTDASLFERYLLPIVPFGAALVVVGGRRSELTFRRPGLAAGIALAALAVAGLLFVDASATLDGAKWRLASSVVGRTGFDPAHVDGGFEWYTFHQPDDPATSADIEGRSFWVALYGDRPVCVTLVTDTGQPVLIPGSEVANDPIERLVARGLTGVEYRLVAIAGPDRCNSE